MDNSLKQLQQIADEFRSLPDAFPDILDNVTTGIPLVDESLKRQKRGNISRLMAKGGKLIYKAIFRFDAFRDRDHATFRLNVEDSKAVSPKTWPYEVFNLAANEFASFEFAQLGGVRRAWGPIADAIEAEIKRMEASASTSPLNAKPEAVENQGGRNALGSSSARLTPEQKAVLFISDEMKTTGKLPTKTAIAEKLDISRRTLGNWRAFKVAYANLKKSLQKRPPPRGSKTEGKIEAWWESGK